RGRALAVYYVSIAIGSGASLLLGGWLLAAIPTQGLVIAGLAELSSWRAAFIAAATPGVPLALVLLLSVREPTRREDTSTATTDDRPSVRDFMRYLGHHTATFVRVLT